MHFYNFYNPYICGKGSFFRILFVKMMRSQKKAFINEDLAKVNVHNVYAKVLFSKVTSLYVFGFSDLR